MDELLLPVKDKIPLNFNELNHIEVGLQLRKLGYSVRIATGCIDLFADRYYLLSLEEGRALLKYTLTYGKLEDVSPYAERRGLNYWFTFPD